MNDDVLNYFDGTYYADCPCPTCAPNNEDNPPF